MLWSTLSPANNRDWPRMSTSAPNTSEAREHAVFISNLCTSGYDEANPMFERLSIKNCDLYKCCICTATPSCRGAITAPGRIAWTTACPMPATFLDVSFPTNKCCNENCKLAGITSNAAVVYSAAVVSVRRLLDTYPPLAQLLSWYHFWWVQHYRVGKGARF